MIKESIGMLLKSYEINTQNKDTVYNLSYITYKLGDFETALSMLNAIKNKDKDITGLIDEIMEASNEQ
jgi:lipopolysaccharide biosynthesis regulator YciM